MVSQPQKILSFTWKTFRGWSRVIRPESIWKSNEKFLFFWQSFLSFHVCKKLSTLMDREMERWREGGGGREGRANTFWRSNQENSGPLHTVHNFLSRGAEKPNLNGHDICALWQGWVRRLAIIDNRPIKAQINNRQPLVNPDGAKTQGNLFGKQLNLSQWTFSH